MGKIYRSEAPWVVAELEQAIVVSSAGDIIQDAIVRDIPIEFNQIFLGDGQWKNLSRNIVTLKSQKLVINREIEKEQNGSQLILKAVISPADGNEFFIIREIALGTADEIFIYAKTSSLPYIPGSTEAVVTFILELINNK